MRFVLAQSAECRDCLAVRMKKTSVVILSVLVLTATQTIPISSGLASSSNPQAAEAKTQETVDLKISGMT
jgi:hypothetical protein